MRLALLTNFIPPYRRTLYEEIERQCTDFRILLSAVTEPGRTWTPEWGELPVQLQRSIALRGTWRYPSRFSEPLTVHFPYDTVPQLARFRPDVIISCELGLRTLQAALYHWLSPDSKFIIWAKLSDVTEQGRGLLRHWLRTFLLRKAGAVITNGEGGVRYLRRLGLERERMFIAPATTELPPFLALPATRGPDVRHRLLYSGVFTERKGVLPFLSVLADWARNNPQRHVELSLVGHGPLRSQITSFNGPSNLDVRLLGSVAYDRLPDIYREGGILAFPTLADEWGMVVTEAMASGLPVLGSIYSQAVEELVQDNESGWVFRPDHPHEMRDALDRALATSAPRLNEMAENARARVRNVTPAVVAGKIMAAVEYTLRPQPSPIALEDL